jgi:hypothetical protein
MPRLWSLTLAISGRCCGTENHVLTVRFPSFREHSNERCCPAVRGGRMPQLRSLAGGFCFSVECGDGSPPAAVMCCSMGIVRKLGFHVNRFNIADDV